MKNKTLRTIVVFQATVVFLFLFLTLGNEIIDIPHYVFGDAPTQYSQRMGEIGIEFSIFLVVIILQSVMFLKFYRRIRILEGFIPICANCKKIRNEKEQWEQMERYISQHSLAEFSHGICPDCAKKLYPDIYADNAKD